MHGKDLSTQEQALYPHAGQIRHPSEYCTGAPHSGQVGGIPLRMSFLSGDVRTSISLLSSFLTTDSEYFRSDSDSFNLPFKRISIAKEIACEHDRI
jgi:hypothetical protein